MAKYLVTGCSGLLGSHLISVLSKEHEVVSLGRSIPSTKIRHIEADFSDPDFTKKIDFIPDGIYHLAQSEHYRKFPEASNDVFTVNTVSTYKLLDFCVRNNVKKFLYASSGAVYGKASQPYLEENPLPVDACAGNFYAASKLAAENICRAYSSLCRTIICRYFFIYGPGQKETMLIPNLMQRVIQRQPITLQGEQGLLLNPIYVEDAALLTIKAMEHAKCDLFNIAGQEVVSLKALVEIIGEIVYEAPIFSPVEGVPKNCVASIASLKKSLSIPQIPLKIGLKLIKDDVKKPY